MREGGGNSLKYLRSGWNRKEGKGNKDFKKGEEAGSRGGCLEKRGWNALTNYGEILYLVFIFERKESKFSN